MAFDPLVPTETPAPEAQAPAAPDPAQAAIDARLAALRAEMEQRISEAYRSNKGYAPPQVQYVPYAPQAPEPELTDADILADLPGAIERAAAQREQAVREELGQHLATLYEREFNRDLKELRSDTRYAHVKDELEEFIQANPAVKYEQGGLQRKFHELLGSKVDDIVAARAEAAEVARTRAVEAPLPTSISPMPPKGGKDADPTSDLSAEERESIERSLRFYNNRFGLNMSVREFVEIENGKHLPPDYSANPDAFWGEE